jgi:hypothetical protein
MRSLIAIVVGMALAVALLWRAIPELEARGETASSPEAPRRERLPGAGLWSGSGDEAPASEPGDVRGDPAALAYVNAMRDRDFDRVIELTGWMREYLSREQAVSSGPDAAEGARGRLMTRLAKRDMEANCLTPEGVPDKYVFAPGVEVRVIAKDPGRADLDKPVRSRTWFEVTFPHRGTALADGRDRPIRSIIVGVNVSGDGQVLKAGVAGNVELDLASVSFNWNNAGRVSHGAR